MTVCYRCNENESRLCVKCANDLQDAGQGARTARIEALATQATCIAELEQALEPFAVAADSVARLITPSIPLGLLGITMGDLHAARRALREQGTGGAGEQEGE